MSSCLGKTIVISGNHNNTGLEIGLRYASEGGNVLFIIHKNESYDQDIFQQIKKINAKVELHQINLDDEKSAEALMKQTKEKWGSIDILVNNLGLAFNLDTLHIHAQQFDSMYALNVRSAFLLSKVCCLFLKNAGNPHIVNISPPLDINKEWFKNHLALSMSTYSTSMCTLGMSVEFKKMGIAVNSIWPKDNNIIADKTNSDNAKTGFKALAENVFLLSQKQAKECTGNFFLV